MLASSLDGPMLDLRSKSVRRATGDTARNVGRAGYPKISGLRNLTTAETPSAPMATTGRGQSVRDGGAAGDKDSRAGSVRARWRARAAARSADDTGFFSSSRTPAARSLSQLRGAPYPV